MTFTTLTFLLFLPVIFATYWLLNDYRQQNVLLLVASYFFCGWCDYRFCFLLLASGFVDFGIGLWLHRSEKPSVQRAIVIGAVVLELGILGYFKYFNFFADSFTPVFASSSG